MYEYYLSLLKEIPEFLEKYLVVPSLVRLKGITYFCGMDYASKEIYNFKEKITRYDHSLTTALLTYKYTHNKEMTIAALFHDIATPCFSHVIDYMNKDYATQESTEKYTQLILDKDKYLKKSLMVDNLNLEDINYKKYPLVDNKRPKLCADRLDGIILTGALWTQELNEKKIKEILDSLTIYDNELGFNNLLVAQEVLKVSNNIDIVCHCREDNYMMELLANITRLGILNNLYSYEDLYFKKEIDIFKLLEASDNLKIKEMLDMFYNIKKENIVDIELPYIKKRDLNPLVKGKRLQ